MGDCGHMGKSKDRQLGFLGRLLKSQAGNTLAIVAAAIIPLAALIGGGLDMSRAYMVRARLQQACDAAALAGRRAMTTSTMTDANKAEAKKFFDFNFQQNTFGSASFTPVIQSKTGDTTTVQVTADTSIPTTVMRIFGYKTMALSVTCESRFDIGNTDVALVLDVTGSMDSSISTGVGNATTTRIAALRQAVRDFYDTLGAGSIANGRIRYGFVPYSSTANVGYMIPSEYMVGSVNGETSSYNSRIGNYYLANNPTDSTCYKQNGLSTCYATATEADQKSGTTLSGSNCSTWQNAKSTSSGSAPSNTTTVTYSYGAWNGSTSTQPSGSTARKCTRKEVTTTTTYQTSTIPQQGWTRYGNWSYTNVDLDTSLFVKGNAIQNPAFEWGTNTTWAGCIEESQTVNTITSSTSISSIPTGAYDLDPDLIPDTKAKKWKPFWPDASWYRSSTPATSAVWNNWAADANDDYAVCVARARMLATYSSRSASPSEDYGSADASQSTYDGYVSGLTAGGFTNHTVGITWGARMLSPDGIFASKNGIAPNGFATSKNIVFMTDGAMQIPNNNYDAWGINALNGRIAATSKSSADLKTIQEQRFKIACEAAKRKGITIWIIVFSTSSNDALNSCATSANHIAVSSDASSLSDDFKDIAKNIGGLRLSQ
jgi:Flp pilus assembly protein TadG